jgi:hypothetical protein
MLADAVVVEQAVAVAEVDALGDGIHAGACYLVIWSSGHLVERLTRRAAQTQMLRIPDASD